MIQVLIVAGALAIPVCPAHSFGSFQATLDWPPSYVTPYKSVDQEFSVALGAPINATVIGVRRFEPRPERSSFENNSLTFVAYYARVGGITRELIPVSVDANNYLEYRLDESLRETRTRMSRQSMTDANRRNQDHGLGIKVALPKRLDAIFGEGGAGLTVSGYRRITFSGRSQWTDAARTDVYSPSKFPSLNMEQISRFDITGTIGTKISVKVSQDSQTDIPLENRIQIRYKGDEDDILKTIEAGNTNLNLPNTQFVGYSSRIRGLFGIKSEAQIGDLTLTAIASQEKGTSDRATFTPSGEESAEDIRDYEYAEDRIFDLGLPGELDSADIITSLFVFEQENDDDNLEAYDAVIHVDPTDTSAYTAERITGIRVKEVEPNRYAFFNDINRGLHYIVFTSSAIYNRAIGVWMVVQREGGGVDTLGSILAEPYQLKLIRHNSPNPDHQTWQLMWRNCYTIPRGVTVDGIDIRVMKGLAGSEKTSSVKDYQEVNNQTQSYLEILGLDRYNTLDQRIPDGLLDDRVEIFRPEWGLLIFPEREPFNSSRTFTDSLGRTTQELQVKVEDIYDFASSTEQRDASQYFIRISTRERSEFITLNRPNIIEGSERIAVNGRTLSRGTDYNIDYNFGRVTLLSEEALDPNADISIDYEYAPFLALQKKTLLGARAEYEWSKDFNIGSTILYKSDQAQERKPRVGEETSKMVVYDIDATLKLRPGFLTDFVDALPLLQTKAQSGLTISGEVAQSHPNPNVDGVAYVDDFESALEQLSLGVSRTTWQLASEPAHVDMSNYLRGKVIWHQPRDAVLTQDVYDLETGRGEGSLRTLKIVFRPRHDSVEVSLNEEGTELIETPVPGEFNSWGGIMRYISGVDPERVQLFEARLRGSRRGRLHFDFGRISEDVNNNSQPDTEDRILRNQALEEEEDTGVDGLMDPEEPNYLAGVNVDPNGDNWYFLGEGKCPLPPDECEQINWDDESIRYEWINGTEGNIDDISVLGRPDREQLTSSNFNTTDAYFSYVIDMEDDAQFLVEGSEKGPADNPWRTYRIPIRDTTVLDAVQNDENADASWSQVNYVRVWFEDQSQEVTPDTIEVAGWYFVQSNWADSVHVHPRSRGLDQNQQTRFVVASVSEEDGTYSPPADVEPYEDPNTGLTEPRRGLLLHFENLNHFDTCLAIKRLPEVDKYSGYRRMEMYVHGGDGVVLDPNGEQQLALFMRIGQDSANYYEVRQSVYPGWNKDNYINIDFNALTAYKDSVIRSLPEGESEVDAISDRYRVLGYPNLNEIKYFVVGLANRDEADTVGGLTGDIWLDELRVTDVRKDVGTAARVTVSGNLADLFNYRFGYQTQDPYFRSVSSATRGGGDNNLGSGRTQTSYNYNLTFNVDRFLPKAWGARIPISYSYSKSTTIPLLRTGSDIVLPEEVRELEKSVSENRNFTISERFGYKGSNPLFTLLLNRQNVSVSYRRSQASSPTSPYSFGENLTVKSGFDLSVKNPPTLPIFFWTKWIPIARRASDSKLGLYPSRWNLSATYTRNASISDDINMNRRSSLKRDLVGTMDLSYSLFQNLSMTYRYSTRRDLSDLNLVNLSLSDLRLGLETNYSQNFSASYDPKLISFLTTSFNYKVNYSDDYDRSSESRHGKLSRDMGVKGTFDHMKLFGGSGSSQDRRFRGRRSNTRSGAQQESEGDGKPFYDPVLSVLRFLTGWIQAPTYGYSENFNNQLPGMLSRPSYKHRFGLQDYPDVDTVTATRAPTASEGQSYNLGSGFSLLGGLSVDVKFSRSISRDLITRSSRYEKINTKWPTLSIRIARFSSLPIIQGVVNKLIEVFDPRTGYNRSTRETIDLDVGHTTSSSETVSYNPLISFNFKVFRKLTLTTKYTLTKDMNENFNLATGQSEKVTRSQKKSLDFSTSYSFSAPGGIGIPLFGKMKFKSQMSIQLRVSFNSSLSETSTRGGPWVPSSNKSDFTWSASAKYSFSQQVNGGLTMRWQDSNDATRNRRSHVRELQLWAELRF